MQIKPTMRYYFISTRMASKTTTATTKENNKCQRECGKIGTIANEPLKWYSHYGKHFSSPFKRLNIQIPQDSEFSSYTYTQEK